MKKISVDHLARVEGNGGISATIDGKIVSDVKFSVYEGPRLIEKLTIGRTPEEDVSISPRICAICSVSHKNAVLRAIENALDVKISQKSYHLRELMHMGEFIESHSLTLFTWLFLIFSASPMPLPWHPNTNSKSRSHLR